MIFISFPAARRPDAQLLRLSGMLTRRIEDARVNLTRAELFGLRLVALPAAAISAPFRASTTDIHRATLTQSASIRINASPHDVHALLNPSQPANRWTIRRQALERIAGRAGAYRLHERSLPGRPILLEVTASNPGDRIAYRVGAEDGQAIGALARSASEYRLTRDDAGRCRVVLDETIEYEPRLNAQERAFHAALMKISMRNDLLRLKFEAETGRDAG